MLQGFEQRLQVNGEACRGIVRTITAQKVIVPSAAADAIAQIGGEAFKGNARIVMEPADIAEIDEHTVFQTVGLEYVIYLSEIRQRRLGGPALAEMRRLLQHFR